MAVAPAGSVEKSASELKIGGFATLLTTPALTRRPSLEGRGMAALNPRLSQAGLCTTGAGTERKRHKEATKSSKKEGCYPLLAPFVFRSRSRCAKPSGGNLKQHSPQFVPCFGLDAGQLGYSLERRGIGNGAPGSG